MIFYAPGCWMFGLAWIGVLSLLAPPELRWAAVAARTVLVAGLAVVLGVTVVIVAASNSVNSSSLFSAVHPSQAGVWFYVLACAIPVTVLGFLVSRPALPHRVAAGVAGLAAVAFLVAAAAAFRAEGSRLDGLALTAHRHLGRVVAALLLPLVALTVAVAMPGRS